MTQRLPALRKHFQDVWVSLRTVACQKPAPPPPGFDPWVGKIPWRRKWQPTPVFLPGESHGQRTVFGYSPWGRKELDMTSVVRVYKALIRLAS